MSRVTKHLLRDRVFFQSRRNDESAKNEFFGLYRRKVNKTVAFGKQCEMKTQRRQMKMIIDGTAEAYEDMMKVQGFKTMLRTIFMCKKVSGSEA